MASDRAKLKKLADLIKDHVGNEALTTSYLRKNAVDALNILEGENKEVIVDLDRQLNSAIEIIFDHQVTEEQLQGKLKESEKKLEKEEKKSKKFEILFEKVGSRLSLKRKVAKEYKETAENNGLPVEEYEEKLENDEQKKRQLKSFVASRLAVFKQEIEDEIDNNKRIDQWTFWYLNDQRALSWEERLKEVCTFSTIEEFWALYNNIKPPSGLANTCDYNIFKKGIQPMWEVPENAKGGRWLINIEKGRSSQIMDLIWLEIILATIGEQFGKDMELICGLVCNIRNKGNKISIWTRDFTDDEGNMRIGNIIKNKLLTVELPRGQAAPIFDVLRYEDHDSCQKKSGSMVKARHQINAVEKMERD